jgi:truncated hemoglobin YjbI
MVRSGADALVAALHHGAGARPLRRRSRCISTGGKEAITAVVDDFRARVVKDPRISAKFEKSDPERLRCS